MAQLWFWLLFGNEHNALGQGLMLGLNWLRFAWFLHLLHAWFWASCLLVPIWMS